ncbi:MAG: hypothetical protein K2L89_01040, partial [Muribaculaceae bacterium]|nr:hypothetical protein [Muribaculaceae bacterium]
NLSSADSLECMDEETLDYTDQPNEQADTAELIFQRKYDEYGYPIYTDEDIEIYEQAVEDMDKKSDSFLNKCREIFYNEGKEALHKYLNDVEEYSSNQDAYESFDDPKYFTNSVIRQIRERFNVWDVEKERLKREKMWEEMQRGIDDYWNDPNREKRADWVSATLVQDLKDYFEESHNRPSFAEFVSLIRRGEFGILPEDYDGLAVSGNPGYYGEQMLYQNHRQ